MKPERIQRKRVKGWKMPENTVCVTRGTGFGNPFKVGGWFKVGDLPGSKSMFRFSWVQAYNPNEPGFTLIKDNAQAVEMFWKLIEAGYFKKDKLETLRGKNLACFCPIGSPCHADVLLQLANA